MKLKTIFFFMLLCVGHTVFAQDIQTGIEKKPDRSSVSTRDTLVISFPVDFPPYMFLNAEGSVAGMFADIWRLWAKKTGSKIAFLPANTWKTSIENIRNRAADVHPGIFYESEQYEGMFFSQVFYESGVGLFFPVEQGTRKIAELSGQCIGALRGTTQEFYLKNKHPDIDAVLSDTREGMIYAARAGKTRGFISVLALGISDINRLGLTGEFEIGQDVLYTGKFCAGVLKENKQLLAKIDNGFNLISNDELAEIEKPWIPDPEKRYFKPDMKKIRLTAQEEEWLKAHPRIALGLFTDIEPAMFVGENNEFQGIIKELADIICKRTGIRFEIVPIYPDMRKEIPAMLRQGKIDVFPGFETPERKKYLNFTDPVYTVSWIIAARSDMPFISGLRDLKSLNLKVAYIKNMKWHRQLAKDYPDMAFVAADTSLEALRLVSHGKADAAVLGLDVAAYLIRKHSLHNLKIGVPAGYPDSVTRLAVRKDFPELADILNKAIASVDRREHDQIIQKWIPVHLDQRAVRAVVIKWGLGIGAVFIVILGISVFWNRRLAREIAERRHTEEKLRKLTRQLDERVKELNCLYGISKIAEEQNFSLETFFSQAAQLLAKSWQHPETASARIIVRGKQYTADNFRETAWTQTSDIIVRGKSVGTIEVCYLEEMPDCDDGPFLREENLLIRAAAERIGHIIERTEGEEMRRISEERFRAIFENSAVSIGLTDVQGQWIQANQAFASLLQYSADELLQMTNQQITFEADRDMTQFYMSALMKGEMNSFRAEKRYIRKDGHIVWVDLCISALRDKNGGIEALVGIGADITGRKQMDDALRISLEKYKVLFESFPIGLSVTDDNGNLLEANPESERLLGVSVKAHNARRIDGPEWKVIRPDRTRMPPDEYPGIRAFKTRQAVGNVEMGIVKENQEITWINAYAAPVPIEGYGAVIAYSDITARKQMEDALRIKDRVIASSVSAIVITDSTGKLTYVNDSFLQLLGYDTEADVIGKHTADFWNSQDEAMQLIAELQRRKSLIGETIAKRKDGSLFDAYFTATLVTDESDRIVCMMASIIDISERRQAENALRENEAKYRFLAENAEDVIWSLDENLRFTYISPSVYKLRGLTPEEAVKEHPFETLTPESLKIMKETHQRRLEREAQGLLDTTTDIEVEQYRKDGSTVWVRIIVKAVFDAENNKIGYLGVSRNISRRKKLEEELRKAKEAAEAATRAKSEFLANMSHEIRTPMNAIVNMNRLLLNTPLDEEQQDYAETATASSEILLTLIDDILDFSKIEAGKLELECTDFSLPESIGAVVKILGPKAEEKGLRLTHCIEPDVHPYLKGDPIRLRQILINFVNNAVKFTEKGSIVIRVSSESLTESHTTLKFEVADTGIGIPKDRMEKLFKSFSQADSSTTRKYGGTGLGLAISKQLAELMGGNVGVESEEGRGSIFWFTAVLGRGQVAGDRSQETGIEIYGDIQQPATRIQHPASSIQHPASSNPQSASSNPQPATCRILIAEDNIFNQKVSLAILGQHGLSADVASNGREAVEALRKVPYDLVLMDMQMPETDGIEATRMIRNPDSGVLNPDVPIVAMTANATPEDRKKCTDAGMNDYLAKPVDPESLFSIISRLLKGAGCRGQLAGDRLQGTGCREQVTGDRLQGTGCREQVTGTEIHGDIQQPATSNQHNQHHASSNLPATEIFDFEELLDRMGGDFEFIRGIIIKEIPNTVSRGIEKIKAAADEKDAEKIGMHAHTLKGMSANISARRLSQAALGIELIGKQGCTDIAHSLKKLKEEYERLRAVLSEMFPDIIEN